VADETAGGWMFFSGDPVRALLVLLLMVPETPRFL
jgi:hypothetical protein